MRLLCITALVLTMPNRIIASTKYDEQYRNYNIGVIGEIASNSTWQLEISYHWFPIQYVGVGASVGLWRQIEGDNIPATDDWRIKEQKRNEWIFNAFFNSQDTSHYKNRRYKVWIHNRTRHDAKCSI